jgi:hypothetical protein
VVACRRSASGPAWNLTGDALLGSGEMDDLGLAFEAVEAAAEVALGYFGPALR